MINSHCNQLADFEDEDYHRDVVTANIKVI